MTRVGRSDQQCGNFTLLGCGDKLQFFRFHGGFYWYDHGKDGSQTVVCLC